MDIITNNVPREVLAWHELSEKEQAELKDNYADIQESSFLRYRGQVYDVADFLTIQGHHSCDVFKSWHGYSSGTYFSGTIIKLLGDGQAIIGRYYS